MGVMSDVSQMSGTSPGKRLYSAMETRTRDHFEATAPSCFFFYRSDRQDSDALLLQHGFVEEEPPFGRKFTMTSPRHYKILQQMVRKIIP